MLSSLYSNRIILKYTMCQAEHIEYGTQCGKNCMIIDPVNHCGPGGHVRQTLRLQEVRIVTMNQQFILNFDIQVKLAVLFLDYCFNQLHAASVDRQFKCTGFFQSNPGCLSPPVVQSIYTYVLRIRRQKSTRTGTTS